MTPVIMPQISQESASGRIVQWCKQEGDPVARGEVLLQVESEKAVFEVTADETGVLRQIVHPADTEVPILEPVGWIGQPGEPVPAAGTYRRPEDTL